jgi:hypothetical protein
MLGWAGADLADHGFFFGVDGVSAVFDAVVEMVE